MKKARAVVFLAAAGAAMEVVEERQLKLCESGRGCKSLF